MQAPAQGVEHESEQTPQDPNTPPESTKQTEEWRGKALNTNAETPAQTVPVDTQHKKGGEAAMGKTTLYCQAKSYAQPSTYALTRRPKSEEGRGVR